MPTKPMNLLSIAHHYECQRCTACCRWPGQVRITDEDISRMSVLLRMSEYNFIQEYTRLRSDRRGLALKEMEDCRCVFLQGSDCVVQVSKPKQCLEFPNGWSFPGFETVCKAIRVCQPA